MPAGQAVQLGQRHRRVGGWLKPLNHRDGGRQVAGLLVQLSQHQPDAVAAHRQLHLHSPSHLKGKGRVQKFLGERVGGRVLAAGKHPRQQLPDASMVALGGDPGAKQRRSEHPIVGMLVDDPLQRRHVLGADRLVQRLLALGSEHPRSWRRRRGRRLGSRRRRPGLVRACSWQQPCLFARRTLGPVCRWPGDGL
jgi:hypothetical protein